MRQCMALAGLACLLAAGCAQMGGVDCGDSCGAGIRSRGPRPLITRDASRPSGRLFGNRGCATEDCETCGPDGCSLGPCGACDGCSNGGPCARLAEHIASGMCNGGCCGLCPNGQSYPEYPRFNPGPPTGQVAYPYYTTRGPRDFLMKNPPSIGP